MKMRSIYMGLAILMLLATACQAQPPVSATPVAPAPAAESPSAVPTATLAPAPATPAPTIMPSPQPSDTPSTRPTKAPTPKPGTLTMKMAQAVYTPDSEQLKATIKNGSSYTFTFGEASYLQQKTSGGWKTVPFTQDVAWIEIAYMLQPGESKDVTLSLSLFATLPAGSYRLAKDVYRNDADATKDTLYAEFRIESDNNPDIGGLVMTMKKDIYSPNSAEIKATLKNGTEYMCTFGVEARLQKKSGGSWKDVPFKEDVAWIALAQLLEPGKSTDVSLSLSLFHALGNGTYRLVKDVSFDLGNGQSVSARATAEFRIG